MKSSGRTVVNHNKFIFSANASCVEITPPRLRQILVRCFWMIKGVECKTHFWLWSDFNFVKYYLWMENFNVNEEKEKEKKSERSPN